MGHNDKNNQQLLINLFWKSTLVYTLVSNQDDWDRYEGLQWYAANEWASENPDDADVEEVLKRVRENKENYLKWGRDTFGWAIYMFKKEVIKR